MHRPIRAWTALGLKSLLLTILVLLSFVGVVNLVFGWSELLRVWSQVSTLRKEDSTREKAREQNERYLLEATLKSSRRDIENLQRRLQAVPKDPIAVVLNRTFSGPFPTRPASWVLTQPRLGLTARVDSADNLELGEIGRTYYRERLGPYRRAFGGESVEFIPIRIVRQGAFESLQVFAIKDTLAHALFTLTLNHASRRVIQRNVALEGEGVFLHSVDPSNRFFVLDYGCCPGVRGFEIFNAMGASRLRGSYHGALQWQGDTLSLWKVEKDAGHGSCPGALDSRIKVRRTAFRSGREEPTDSVRILCLDPGG